MPIKYKSYFTTYLILFDPNSSKFNIFNNKVYSLCSINNILDMGNVITRDSRFLLP